MDEATIIDLAVKAALKASNSGFDWKLFIGGIGISTAFITAISALASNWIRFRELKHEGSKKWGRTVIDAFSQLDGEDRKMIFETNPSKEKLGRISRQDELRNDFFDQMNEKAAANIKKHGTLLTKFRLLFDSSNKEHESILSILDDYNEHFLKRLTGMDNRENREGFDAATNQLCKQLGTLIQINNKF